MPTFTAIALENLLEPRVAASLKDAQPENGRLNISAAKNAAQCPISPSPNTAKYKSRGRGDGSETLGVADDDVDWLGTELDEEFLRPRSELGSTDLTLIQIENRSVVSAQGEFFDAIDEFSSDGSISNTPSFEYRLSEFHATRLNLLEEIGKRKTTDETLLSMHTHWARIRTVMSEAGLTFPAPPAIGDSVEVEDQLLDQMSQEVVVAKYVAEAVGRGLARAEAEEAATAATESKDQEIMRLHDKLQYYETVNHEMSQRKLVEVARKQQERKSRRRWAWVWSFLGLVIPVGASLAAYSYTSHTPECNASRIEPSETSQGH